MKTITLDLDYSLNGAVLYAAGQPHPHSAHLQSLIDNGIAGTVADDEVAAEATAEAGTEAALEAAPEAATETTAQTSAQTTEAQ